jgi:hypothetical protein
VNNRDLDRLLRQPAPDEPRMARPFAPPAEGVVEVNAVQRVQRGAGGGRGRRSSVLGAAVVLMVALAAGAVALNVALPRGGAGSASPAASPSMPPGVAVTREAAVAVALANGGGGTMVDARVGHIGDFDPNQRVVPADRLVWAITFSGGNSSTDFVDATTGAWLEGMSPAPAVITGSLSTAGLALASSLPGSARVTVGDLIVAVPAGWRFYAMSEFSSFTSRAGVLANFDLGAACGLPDISGGCLQNLSLRSGQALVFVGNAGFPGWTVEGMKPAGGWSAFIAGLPAALTVTTSDIPYGAAQARSWQIARQDSEDNRYTVDGYLGADPGGLAEQVDAIAKEIALVKPVVPLPTGAAGSAAGARAAAAALASLRAGATPGAGSSYYACFPAAVGTPRPATITDGPNGTLRAPLAVTCRADIAPTETQVWHLTLTVSWEAGPAIGAGSMTQTLTLAADGSVGNATTGGDPLPGSP